MSVALVNHMVRKKDKESSSSSITTEALTTRGMSFNYWKGKRDVGKPTTGNLKLRKIQCAFCKEGHWKIDCPRLKKEKGQKSKANFIQVDDSPFILE